MPSFLIVQSAPQDGRLDAYRQPPTLDIGGMRATLDWGDITLHVPAGDLPVTVFVTRTNGQVEGATVTVRAPAGTGTRLTFMPPLQPGGRSMLRIDGQWASDSSMHYYAARDARVLQQPAQPLPPQAGPVQRGHTQQPPQAQQPPQQLVTQQPPQQLVTQQPPQQLVTQQPPQQLVTQQPPQQLVTQQPPQQSARHPAQQPAQQSAQQLAAQQQQQQHGVRVVSPAAKHPVAPTPPVGPTPGSTGSVPPQSSLFGREQGARVDPVQPSAELPVQQAPLAQPPHLGPHPAQAPSFGQRPQRTERDVYGREHAADDKQAPPIPTPAEFHRLEQEAAEAQRRVYDAWQVQQHSQRPPARPTPHDGAPQPVGLAAGTGQTQPNWYPDPFRRAESRWFDGRQWTASVVRGGVRGTDQPG